MSRTRTNTVYSIVVGMARPSRHGSSRYGLEIWTGETLLRPDALRDLM